MTILCEAPQLRNRDLTGSPRVLWRRFPYPYRAMLVICSDLDETPDRHVYREIMRFLNTTQTTSIGPGIGLEVGNTVYFDMPPNQFAYWNTDDAGREMVRALIRSGHIDCLHSYGDLATTRGHAGRALDELARHDCRLEVWIDHAVAPSNLGADIMRGSGDVPGSDVYHADLTCEYGIKYVWQGRITSIIGQDVPRRLGGIFTPRHPARSAITFGKESLKGVLGRRGSVKYAMHGANEVIRRARLRDGHSVHEFLRSNPYWGGVENAATADGLASVVTRNMLELLVQREGFCILYTHLGKVKNREKPFGAHTRNALRLLAELHRDGRLLVTTTRRLLGFCRAVREFSVAATQDEKGTRINLSTKEGTSSSSDELPARDLHGLTFYVPDPDATRVIVNGREVPDLCRNGADHTGRRSVSLPWPALELPDV